MASFPGLDATLGCQVARESPCVVLDTGTAGRTSGAVSLVVPSWLAQTDARPRRQIASCHEGLLVPWAAGLGCCPIASLDGVPLSPRLTGYIII